MGYAAVKMVVMSGSGKTLCRSIRQHTCRYLHRQVCDIGAVSVGTASRLVTQCRGEW
jgi:hypothetical protein